MPGKKPSPRRVSASYRGRNQPRRNAARKPAKGLSKAMKGTIHGKKAWN